MSWLKWMELLVRMVILLNLSLLWWEFVNLDSSDPDWSDSLSCPTIAICGNDFELGSSVISMIPLLSLHKAVQFVRD